MKPSAAVIRVGLLISSGLAGLAALSVTSSPAGAGPIVDPATLEPAPPPGAQCRADGSWTICDTGLQLTSVNEPITIPAPCGTVYETSTDRRFGTRWYQDGKLVKRFVRQDLEGTWSLSPTGGGPTATVSAHQTWRNVYTVAGDDTSGPVDFHGDALTVQAAGYGVILHIAGLDAEGEGHRGLVRIDDDPAALAELCEALRPA